MSAFADKITPGGRKLEHAQGMSGGCGIKNNMVVFRFYGFVGDKIRKFVEGRNFYGAGTGKLFLHII